MYLSLGLALAKCPRRTLMINTKLIYILINIYIYTKRGNKLRNIRMGTACIYESGTYTLWFLSLSISIGVYDESRHDHKCEHSAVSSFIFLNNIRIKITHVFLANSILTAHEHVSDNEWSFPRRPKRGLQITENLDLETAEEPLSIRYL